MVLGRYEFGSNCIVEPLSTVNNPEMISIGDGSFIKNFTVLRGKRPKGITIGEDCRVNQFSFLAGSIEMGDGVRVANQVSMHSFDHGTDPEKAIYEQGLDMGEIRIGDDVWIGSGARILKDVSIGEGAVVGAGAVVTSDIEPYTIVAGNPAEEIGER